MEHSSMSEKFWIAYLVRKLISYTSDTWCSWSAPSHLEKLPDKYKSLFSIVYSRRMKSRWIAYSQKEKWSWDKTICHQPIPPSTSTEHQKHTIFQKNCPPKKFFGTARRKYDSHSFGIRNIFQRDSRNIKSSVSNIMSLTHRERHFGLSPVFEVSSGCSEATGVKKSLLFQYR